MFYFIHNGKRYEFDTIESATEKATDIWVRADKLITIEIFSSESNASAAILQAEDDF